MAKNKFKIKSPEASRGSLFSKLENFFRFDQAIEKGLPLRFMPHILFLTALGIIYIGNNHFAERTIREIDRLQGEVEDLRADYTSLKANYMFASKQSEVAKKVEELGLKEMSHPPYKIEIDKGEY